MLGVWREGVTEAAGKLYKLGVIRYPRGQITLLDQPKLEQLCCDCAVIKKESDQTPAAYGASVKPFVCAEASLKRAWQRC